MHYFSDDLEQLFVVLPDLQLVIGVIYLPSYSPLSSFQRHFEDLESLVATLPGFQVLLAGDYNLPGISADDWNCETPFCLPTTKAYAVFESLQLFGLHQFNKLPNAYGNVLDLVLSSVGSIDVHPGTPLVDEDPAHPTLLLKLTVESSPTATQAASCFAFNFKRGNYTSMDGWLASHNWSTLHSLPINDAVDSFYSILNEAIALFVPKTVAFTSNYPKWFSSELIQLVRRKNFAHHRFKITSSLDDYKAFSHLRAKCRSSSRECYSSYLQSVQDRN
ncbi:hypothetical protein GE061_016974 [Apolygus lucorum]|uniref:Endonuclease/exonuclease/phosphatase domain-containing protein n=1 Tax=Apolygus lucorum TaxID=248454 RepID=A0A6A4JVG6_APOLU|nr:hypothetical protein GE061_016974 [Apolygus lucorum]